MDFNFCASPCSSLALRTWVRCVYSSIPIAAENSGFASSGGILLSGTGYPILAGTRNRLSALSKNPTRCDPPPVNTQPAPIASSTPPVRRLSRSIVSSSRARGSRISARNLCLTIRADCPPTARSLPISISFSCGIDVTTQFPYIRFNCSASSTLTCSPTARSFVKWSPPIGNTAVCATLPSKNTTSSVELAPISTTQTPSSRSSAESTASAAASPSNTVSTTSSPARFAQVTTLCAADPEHVDRCKQTSSRFPTIPTGS